MSRGVDLLHLIYQHLAEASSVSFETALNLARELAAEEPETPGAAQGICDAAFHGESLDGGKPSMALYRFIADLPDCPADLAGRALFRYAQCLEAAGNWMGALEAYPNACALLEDADIKDLARFKYAVLSASAEEYGSAVELLESIHCVRVNPHVDPHAVTFHLAFCLIRSGREIRGREILEELAVSEAAGPQWSLKVRHLLADVCYSAGDRQGSARHLHFILDAPGDPATKSRIHHRIATLLKS